MIELAGYCPIVERIDQHCRYTFISQPERTGIRLVSGRRGRTSEATSEKLRRLLVSSEEVSCDRTLLRSGADDRFISSARQTTKKGAARTAPLFFFGPRYEALEVVLHRELNHAPAGLKQSPAVGKRVLVGLHQHAAAVLEVQIDVRIPTRGERPKRMVQEVEG